MKLYFNGTGVTLKHEDFRETLDNIEAAEKQKDGSYIIRDFATMAEYIRADDARLKVDNLVKAYEAIGRDEEAQDIIKDMTRNGFYKSLDEMWEAVRSALFNTYEEITT